MAIDPTRDPHARIVTKPLPSQVRAAAAAWKGEGAGSVAPAPGGVRGAVPPSSAVADDPFLRAENEDDDGYDPYSDRPAPREPLFQEDPWA
ncbi:MAG: hypothetical protein HFJ72_00365 [Adlercreutzia sp.]|uniref:hypothetical protein n=1 Tax=uncultured Adlercreutzia sp. TaxID=875803 RepID=UPI00216BE868|nr:hypothetical protein [uncultured Adlercreutzia sp.]MCI8424111.1 hypothetical protein [Adlercreutzia sp.]